MKNEPIIAYNHLQEEQEEQAHSQESPREKTKWVRKLMMNPLVMVIEIAAILIMLGMMMIELIH